MIGATGPYEDLSCVSRVNRSIGSQGAISTSKRHVLDMPLIGRIDMHSVGPIDTTAVTGLSAFSFVESRQFI